jgi:hypothetical protein
MRSTPLNPQPQAALQALRDLSGELTPPFDWAEFKRRSHRRMIRVPRGAGLRYAALAAGMAVLAVIAMWFYIDAERGRQAARDSDPAPSASTTPEMRTSERLLAHTPSKPVVVRVGSRFALADLEKQIASIDGLLDAGSAAPERVAQLEQDRAMLIQSRKQLRYAETLLAELH